MAGDESESRRMVLAAAAVVAVVALIVVALALSSRTTTFDTEQRRSAEELVAATRRAGVAPNLTVDAAEALYGTKAPTVCEAFAGGPSTAADLLLRGNLAQGRRKVITRDAVTYARLVIETYCPDVLPAFVKDIRSLDPVKTTR